MVIVLSTAFEGTLEEDLFRTAVTTTVQDNPLFTAVVDDAGWLPKWRHADQPQPRINTLTFDHEYPPTDCPQRHLDLTKSTGVEFELRLCANRGILISYFHHACVDGLGAIQFIGDLFAAYGQMTAACEEERPLIRKINHHALLSRGSKLRSDQAEKAPLWHTLKETSRLFFRRSYRVVGSSFRSSRGTDKPEPNILHSRVLPRTVLKQLKKIAHQQGVTLNDVCMMVFLQQLDQLSSTDPKANQSDLFRILMPVSMRRPEHDEISAANVVSYVFHNFRRRDLNDSKTLLQAIHQKSQQMLNRNEAIAMLYGFACTRLVPGLFRLSQLLQPDYASAALTSVGEVRRIFGNRFPLKKGKAIAGNIVIQRIDGIAPVRQNTNLTLAIGTYGGELILHLNRNTQVFSADDAECFLNDLMLQLHSIAKSEQSGNQTCHGNLDRETEVKQPLVNNTVTH